MPFKTISRLAFLYLFLSLAGCGGGGGNNPTDIEISECTIDAQNRFVFDVMNDIYLYYEQIPAVNPSDFASPRALLADIQAPNDPFSFIADREAQQDFFEEGTFNGFGFAFANSDDAFTTRFVYEDSAAGRAGLQRGDVITEIGNTSISEINDAGGLPNFLANFEAAEEISFVVSSNNAEPRDISMSRDIVRINTVLETDVITRDNVNIGYLAFSSFIEPSRAELVSAFDSLQQQNIDELVLDLRYNGGGRVDVAQTLASHIAGNKGIGADVTRLLYNDKNTDLNSNFPFQTLDQTVDIDRLYVLTLESTCSASELLINAMQPIGIEVVTIGQTTCGKPVGSRNINFCDKTLSATTFDVVNDINQGEYFDGISATCPADDDLSSAFADPNESMFATALYHIENGQCPVAFKSSPKKSQSNATNPADIMRAIY